MTHCYIGGSKILHFIGDAASGRLLLEHSGIVGNGEWITTNDLKSCLNHHMTQCVIVQSPNAIQASQVFLDCNIKHIVSITTKTKTNQNKNNYNDEEIDEIIFDFLEKFYIAIIHGSTISRAFYLALDLIQLKLNYINLKNANINANNNSPLNTKTSPQNSGVVGDAYRMFRLLPENGQADDTDTHQVVLFPYMKSGPIQNKTPKFGPTNIDRYIRLPKSMHNCKYIDNIWSTHNHDNDESKSISTGTDICEIIGQIGDSNYNNKKPFLIVDYDDQILSSEIAKLTIIEVSKYLWERRKFTGGVFIIDCDVELKINQWGQAIGFPTLVELLATCCKDAKLIESNSNVFEGKTMEQAVLLLKKLCQPRAEQLQRHNINNYTRGGNILLMLVNFDCHKISSNDKTRLIKLLKKYLLADQESHTQNRVLISCSSKGVNGVQSYISYNYNYTTQSQLSKISNYYRIEGRRG